MAGPLLHCFLRRWEVKHKKGSGVPSWFLVARSNSNNPGSPISQGIVFTVLPGWSTPSLHSSQQRSKAFVQDWNGSSFQVSSPSTEAVSNASGTYGAGACALDHGWFQMEWPEDWSLVHITVKELVPVVIAAAYGEVARGRKAMYVCSIWQYGSSRLSLKAYVKNQLIMLFKPELLDWLFICI